MEIADFENLIEQMAETRAELDRLKREIIEPRQRELDELAGMVLKTLEDHELSSYKGKHGTVIRQVRYSVKTPKSHEDKEAFFAWLREKKGEATYWQYVSVNSQALTAFYNAEVEIAKEEKNFGFKIPGLEAPVATPILSLRKK